MTFWPTRGQNSEETSISCLILCLHRKIQLERDALKILLLGEVERGSKADGTAKMESWQPYRDIHGTVICFTIAEASSSPLILKVA